MDKINELKRKSGVLLHPSSLSGPYGMGELGSEAYDFIDFLEESGQSLWQMLPLGPTGYGDSPYASFSTHGGNPLLVSIDDIVKRGLLNKRDLEDCPIFPVGKVNFGDLIPWKKRILRKSALAFLAGEIPEDYRSFCQGERGWLCDYSLFMALKEHFDEKARIEGLDGAMWSNYWEPSIALREKKALAIWQERLSEEVQIHNVLQYLFFDQWKRLKSYANGKGVSLIGDIPIFVAADSADVWANRELFLLDKRGQPSSVAGVPPDYFSETGQLWGNPLYNWKAMEKNHFHWWIERIQGMLKMVDIIRIDHFRGFEAFWQIPAGEKTAIKGEWIKVPGQKIFKEIKRVLGTLPILAEDLGLITDEVRDLRDRFHFPGMRILQFAFDKSEGDNGFDPRNEFLPHNYTNETVVYTGTHDNSTMRGWIDKCSLEEREYLLSYINGGQIERSNSDLVWDCIRMALSSKAAYAIFPMQDLMTLGDEARMNIPSTLGGNWNWRLSGGELDKPLILKLKKMCQIYGR